MSESNVHEADLDEEYFDEEDYDEEEFDYECYAIDVLRGLTTEDVKPLLSETLEPGELIVAVLSSHLTLSEKVEKLTLISEDPECDDDYAYEIERCVEEINKALEKLGTYPGVVWNKRACNSESTYICEELLQSPDTVKQWEPTFCHEQGSFEDEPMWIELWRMVSTESGRYIPDYVYYLNEESPIYFGKLTGELPYGYLDHGVGYEHPPESFADISSPEYFEVNWNPSLAPVFEVGSIITFDLRPFGARRTSLIIGNENGIVGSDDTKVLYREEREGLWGLATLADLQKNGGIGWKHSETTPSISISGTLKNGQANEWDEVAGYRPVRDYLIGYSGFADQSALKSVNFQHAWDAFFGTESAITDEQLTELVQQLEDGWTDVEETMPLFE